jgi:hypothetical protein
VLWIESVIDPGHESHGKMKPQTNADENAAIETIPLSTLPKSWPASAAAATGKAAMR